MLNSGFTKSGIACIFSKTHWSTGEQKQQIWHVIQHIEVSSCCTAKQKNLFVAGGATAFQVATKNLYGPNLALKDRSESSGSLGGPPPSSLALPAPPLALPAPFQESLPSSSFESPISRNWGAVPCSPADTLVSYTPPPKKADSLVVYTPPRKKSLIDEATEQALALLNSPAAEQPVPLSAELYDEYLALFGADVTPCADACFFFRGTLWKGTCLFCISYRYVFLFSYK